MIDLDLFALELEDTAYWRFEKSNEWPGDNRNADAVVLLERLAKEVREQKGSLLHKKLNSVLRKNIDFSLAIEEENEYRRQIGFHTFPNSGADYLESLVAIYEDHATTLVDN
jgi:hypothetical protein